MLGCEVSTVLDAGCGAGLLHEGLRAAWPEVTIDAFDVSEYACRHYGWQHASLQAFDTDTTYDLVICPAACGTSSRDACRPRRP